MHEYDGVLLGKRAGNRIFVWWFRRKFSGAGTHASYGTIVAFARRRYMYSVCAEKRTAEVWCLVVGKYKGSFATSYSDSYWYKRGMAGENPRKMMYTRPHLMLEGLRLLINYRKLDRSRHLKDGSLYTWGLGIWGQCGTEVTGRWLCTDSGKKVLDNVNGISGTTDDVSGQPDGRCGENFMTL